MAEQNMDSKAQKQQKEKLIQEFCNLDLKNATVDDVKVYLEKGVPMALLLFMIFLKVFNSVVDDFDLLLDHRHSARKIIVFPDLAGQFVNFCVRNRLRDLQCLIRLLIRSPDRDDRPNQRQDPGHGSRYYRF